MIKNSLFLLLFLPSISLAGNFRKVSDEKISDDGRASINANFNNVQYQLNQKLDRRPTDVIPTEDSTFDLGSSGREWANVYADRLIISTPISYVLAYTGNGHGSTATMIRRFTTSETSGAAITYADSAANGATFTINQSGMYAITYSDRAAASSYALGLSVNNANGTTSIIDVAVSSGRLGGTVICSAAEYCQVTAIRYLNANDVVRAHTNGQPNDATDNCYVNFWRIW